jgi:putative addiction module component (TIGR02574 family)
MSQPLRVPPPGFDDLPVADQIDYVQALWERIAKADVPSPEWHRDVVRERLAEHRANPDEGQPWSDARREIEAELKAR